MKSGVVYFNTLYVIHCLTAFATSQEVALNKSVLIYKVECMFVCE